MRNIFKITPEGAVIVDPYEIGKEVTINGEKFYVIKDTGEKVALLAEMCIKKDTNGKYIQAIDAPNVAFSSTNYWSSYEGTYPLNLNTYTPGDATQIKDTDAIEIAKKYAIETIGNGATGRLMTVEEVRNLGENAYSTSGCNEKYPWVNSGFYSLGSAKDDYDVWFVEGSGNCLNFDGYDSAIGYGLRPVIEIFKSSIN